MDHRSRLYKAVLIPVLSRTTSSVDALARIRRSASDTPTRTHQFESMQRFVLYDLLSSPQDPKINGRFLESGIIAPRSEVQLNAFCNRRVQRYRNVHCRHLQKRAARDAI